MLDLNGGSQIVDLLLPLKIALTVINWRNCMYHCNIFWCYLIFVLTIFFIQIEKFLHRSEASLRRQ